MKRSHELSVPIFDLINCLADTIDLVSPEMADHHHRVGLIAWSLAHQLGLSQEEQTDLLFAGNLHDIGALSLTERNALLNFEVDHIRSHAETGALLLEMFTPLAGIADMVRYHHLHWEGGAGVRQDGHEVPLGAHILHLADRIAVLLGTMDKVSLLGKVYGIREKIESTSGAMFAPQLVAAFQTLAGHEAFWLGIAFPPRNPVYAQLARLRTVHLDTEGIIGLSRMFARIIDFRSRFTATHSSGVAASAEALARLAGRPPLECAQMRIAGLLHDLGKLAVPAEILEKPDKLTPHERTVINCHSFFTNRALQNIASFGDIAKWSSYHHEHIDGSGYPFHFAGKELPLGSRIVAVSDVFTAITEDRPYRTGMNSNAARGVIRAMTEHAALDPEVAEMLLQHYAELDALRVAAQEEARREYGDICRLARLVEKPSLH